jgi:hypothetical protein
MARRPSFQWYPGDWLRDIDLRGCSLAARGLWIDMLSLMHQSPRRGYLQHSNGKPMTAEQLARVTGCSTDEVSLYLRELEDAGVFCCTDDGVIYSRRMVRDERRREQYRQSKARRSGRNCGKPVEFHNHSTTFPHASSTSRSSVKNKSPPEGPPQRRSRSSGKLRPPSVDDVAAYCRERGNSVDPQQFVAFYESNGWRVGKNPMRDWKAAVRTWERRQASDSSRSDSGRRRSGKFSGIEDFINEPRNEKGEHGS